MPDNTFLEELKLLCKQNGSLLIVDEIQSGYGRTGKFFAHQYAQFEPDLITIAKGMGNGFPIGGILIHPDIKPWSGMLGTTFGGNHLACAAGLAVLEVIDSEGLIDHVNSIGEVLWNALRSLENLIQIRGRGLMIGFDLKEDSKLFRASLLKDHYVFVGSAMQSNTIRLLPPLGVSKEELVFFLQAFKKVWYA